MPIEKYKKIGFIAGTLGSGGAERQLFYLLQNLKQSGYQPFLISLTKGEYWEQPILDLGVKIYYCGNDKSRAKRFWEMNKILKKEKPQLIYSFHFYTNLYAGLCGLLLSITSVGSVRNDGISEKKANGFLSWLHYAAPNAIIANSDHGKQNCFQIFYKKSVYVLRNAIDLSAFPFNPKVSDNFPLKFLYVGRFENQKQPWLFPEFIKLVNDSGINCIGEMYGDGSLKEIIRNTIESDYTDYAIKLFSTHNSIKTIYQTADCLVLVSKHEGTPNVVLEAMASGLPVATLPLEGIEELITPDITGITEENLPKLALKIAHLLTNSYHKKGLVLNARQKIETDFALTTQIANFESILLQLK